MENFKKAMIIRGGNVIGAVGDKNFSTLHIGCVIPFAGNTDNIPRGYLLADGASYPTVEYPDLYAVIGNTYGGDTDNFNVPDYRETVLVGVGENTTDTIASHDVYELGEFKDDQLQSHTHTYTHHNQVYGGNGHDNKAGELTSATTSSNNGRTGATTHGKQKGVTYIIKAFHTNEGADSGVSDDVIEYVESGLAKKESVYITNDASGSGILYNASEYLGVNSVDTYGLYNLVVTTDTGESGECNFIYKHRVATYGNIISENGVTFSNLNEYGTIVVDSTSANRTFKVKYLGEPTEDMSGLPKYEYTRENKNALASDVNPTIDISKVFSNGTLNIATLCSTYGAGRYVAVGQGTTGNGTVTIDIWTLVGGAISYIVNALYSPKTSTMFVGYTYENPTIDFDANYFTHCNHIAKVCTLA